MKHRAWANLRRTLGRCVLAGSGLLGCENPELVYVELENRPAAPDDAGQNAELDELSSGAGTAGTVSSEILRPPPTNDVVTDGESRSRDATADDVDAETTGTKPSTDPSESSTPDAGKPVGRTNTSSEPRDAQSTPPNDAKGDNDAEQGNGSDSSSDPDDARAEASIICECPDEVNPCLTALCLAGLTICTFTPQPGADCDDDNPCTQADTCDDSGECRGKPKDCSDEDGVCVEGVCNQDNGKCEAKPIAKNTDCDDENRCSVDDACDGKGVCKGKPRDCSDLDSSCTVGTCDQDDGECVATPTNVGKSCDDEDNCTQTDVCNDEGVCGGEAVDCSAASGDCSVGVCDPKDGDCKPEPLSGISCDDGDTCTTLDACDDGECKGQQADDCGDAGWLDLTSGSAAVTMSNECASDDFDVRSRVPEDSDCDRASGDDVVFMLDLSKYEDPVTVRASTSHDATEFDTVLFLMAQECADDALIACVDDSDDDGFASTLSVRVEPGVYALVVDAYRGSEQGVFHLEVALDE